MNDEILAQLLTETTNAAFDCGAWNGDDTEIRYKTLLEAFSTAQIKLKEYIEQNYAQVKK